MDLDVKTRLEDLDSRMAQLEQDEDTDISFEVDQLRSKVALLKTEVDSLKYPEWHPFQCNIDHNNPSRLYIAGGLVYAGCFAKYSWPGASDGRYVSASALANGIYVLIMHVIVDTANGTFTETYKPTLTATLATSFGQAQGAYVAGTPPTWYSPPADGIDSQSLLTAGIVIAVARVASNEWVNFRQRHYSDIYVPVTKVNKSDTATSVNVTDWKGLNPNLMTLTEVNAVTSVGPPAVTAPVLARAPLALMGDLNLGIKAFTNFQKTRTIYVATWYIDELWETKRSATGGATSTGDTDWL